jgi:tRNA(fMet)-specific endonuclease VapC
VQALAWDADAADVDADIRHQMTTTGQPIGEVDMTIAAHAVAIGAVLVTNYTKHFGRIAAPLVLMNRRGGTA